MRYSPLFCALLAGHLFSTPALAQSKEPREVSDDWARFLQDKKGKGTPRQGIDLNPAPPPKLVLIPDTPPAPPLARKAPKKGGKTEERAADPGVAVPAAAEDAAADSSATENAGSLSPAGGPAAPAAPPRASAKRVASTPATGDGTPLVLRPDVRLDTDTPRARGGELEMRLRIARPAPATAAPARDDLRQTAEDALNNSNKLRAAEMDWQSARTGVLRQYATLLPTLSISGTIVRGDTGSNVTGDEGVGLRKNGQAQLSLNLLNGGQTTNGIKATKASEMAARFGVKETRNEVTLATVQSYMNYVLAEDNLRVLEENNTRITSLLTTMEARRKSGFANESDVQQARAEVLAMRQQIADARALRERSRTEAESLAGRKITFQQRFPALERHFKAGKQALVQLASVSPKVMNAQYEADTSYYTAKAVAGRYMPQLDLTGQYAQRFDTAPSTIRDTWGFGVRFSMPLVDVGSLLEYRQRRESALAAHFRAQDTKREAQTKTASLWEQYVGAEEHLKLAVEKSQARRKVVDSWQKQFEMGLVTIDLYLDKHRALAAAEMEETQARNQRTLLMSQILSTAGQLEPSMLGY